MYFLKIESLMQEESDLDFFEKIFTTSTLYNEIMYVYLVFIWDCVCLIIIIFLLIDTFIWLDFDMLTEYISIAC